MQWYITIGALHTVGCVYYDEALADFATAIHLNEQFTDAYCNIGVLFIKQGALTEALSYFEKAAELGHPTADQYTVHVRELIEENR